MGKGQLVGVPAAVMADKRVKDAVEALERKPEKDASTAVLGGLRGGLEKYGVKLRPISLTVVGPMMVQMLSFKPSFPQAYQMTALLFILAAPLEEVYTALAVGEERGTPAFMAAASKWLESSGIPQDMSAEVVASVSETFRVAAKLMGSGEADDGKKAPGHRGL